LKPESHDLWDKKCHYPRVSTGDHPLTKKPVDSGYEIVIPQEEKLLPPILWLIVAYEVGQGDYLVFSVPYQSYIGFLPRRNDEQLSYENPTNGHVYFFTATVDQFKSYAHEGTWDLAAMRGFWGWLGGWSRIW